MLVKLPRQCSSKEVFQAFMGAATIYKNDEKQWAPCAFVGEFQYEPAPHGSIKQTTISKGICVQLFSQEKMWGMIGKKVWRIDPSTTITLTPVELLASYVEVEVVIKHVFDYGPAGNEYIASDPRDPEFKHIRPQLEAMLGSFCARLQREE